MEPEASAADRPEPAWDRHESLARVLAFSSFAVGPTFPLWGTSWREWLIGVSAFAAITTLVLRVRFGARWKSGPWNVILAWAGVFVSFSIAAIVL